MRETPIQPSNAYVLACGEEFHINCNGHRLEYYSHVDFRKYNLHQISFRKGPTRLFSFELVNEEFENFLYELISKNKEIAANILEKVTESAINKEEEELKAKALLIQSQLNSLKHSKYL